MKQSLARILGGRETWESGRAAAEWGPHQQQLSCGTRPQQQHGHRADGHAAPLAAEQDRAQEQHGHRADGHAAPLAAEQNEAQQQRAAVAGVPNVPAAAQVQNVMAEGEAAVCETAAGGEESRQQQAAQRTIPNGVWTKRKRAAPAQR